MDPLLSWEHRAMTVLKVRFGFTGAWVLQGIINGEAAGDPIEVGENILLYGISYTV